MPRHGRRDRTHAEIRDGWRAVVGRNNVLDTADLGYAFGDLVLGVKGVTFVLECKADEKAQLTPGQLLQMQTWRGGPWLRVNSFRDSVEKVGAELERRGIGSPVLSSARVGRA